MRWVFGCGFQERDLVTGKVLFEWSCFDEVDLSETERELPKTTSAEHPWDWFHPNSVTKTASGDYILSARFTSTIYKINGTDASIIWRLGGRRSSFDTDFTVQYQHDAKVQHEENGHMILSFFYNACDEWRPTTNVSTAYVVDLNESDLTATVLKAHQRPDGQVTRLRGNTQPLEDGHTFVGWSERGYVSEFDEAGNLIFDAQFAGTRFDTYRAYMFNFTSRPSEPIALSCRVYDAGESSATTACYVSWNGATEVRQWRLKALVDGLSIDGGNELGRTPKTGFETELMIEGCHRTVVALAYNRDGHFLGTSPVTTAERCQPVGIRL